MRRVFQRDDGRLGGQGLRARLESIPSPEERGNHDGGQVARYTERLSVATKIDNPRRPRRGFFRFLRLPKLTFIGTAKWTL